MLNPYAIIVESERRAAIKAAAVIMCDALNHLQTSEAQRLRQSIMDWLARDVVKTCY